MASVTLRRQALEVSSRSTTRRPLLTVLDEEPHVVAHRAGGGRSSDRTTMANNYGEERHVGALLDEVPRSVT